MSAIQRTESQIKSLLTDTGPRCPQLKANLTMFNQRILTTTQQALIIYHQRLSGT